MRAILSALCCLLLLAPAIGRAQDITTVVRAGEHADFTRLVLSLPDDTAWRLVERDGAVDLIVTDRAVTFDLSQTFARIPRTRLRAVEAVPFGIRLELACPCPVRRVDGIAGQVVLDIVSPPVMDAPDPVVTPPARPLARPATDPLAAPAQRAGAALARLMRGLPPEAGDTDTPLLGAAFPRAAAPPVASAQPQDRAQAETIADMLGTTLAETIAGAVSENLLSPNGQFRPPTDGPARALAGSDLPHILSLQPDRRDTLPTIAQTCQGAVSRHLPDWTNQPDLWTITTDWSGLFDALDQLDPDRAKIKLDNLLRLGFGAEARQLLALMPGAAGHDILQQLSFVIDLEPPSNPDLLLQYAECSDMDALWAYLAAPAPGPMPDGTENRVVRATQTLSTHLRKHLGPAVIHQMLRHGANDMAKLVQASLDRAPGVTARNVEPDLLLGLDPDRLATLSSAEVQDLSDEDVLMLLETAQTRDLAVSQALLDLAMNRQFAHRRSDIGRRLAELTAVALAASGQYESAFTMALGPDAGLAPEVRHRVLAALFDILVTTAGDTDFVVQMFDQAPWSSDDLPQDLRLALALRLEGLGFGPEARQLRQQPARPQATAQDTAQQVQPDEAPRDIALPPATVGPRMQMADAGSGPAAQGPASAGPDRERTFAATPPADTPVLATVPVTVPATVPAAPPPVLPREQLDPASGPLSQGRAAIQASEALRNQVLDLLALEPATPPG